MQDRSCLELNLLGRFAVRASAQGPLRLSSRKSRALLAYLAMQPDFQETRERLATLLWGGRGDAQARQSLRQSLASLRKELGCLGDDCLRIERDSVGLDPDRIVVDARAFLRLSQSGDPADIEQAAELYAGEFLEGLDLDDEGFSDWIRFERSRFASAAASVFESVALHADRAGKGAQAVRAAERLVALDPLRESAQRLLLRLLVRYRGREAALSAAGAVEALWRREIGAELEPETRELIDDLGRAADQTPGWSGGEPSPLPPDPVPAPAVIEAEARRQPPSLRRRPLWLLATAACIAAGALLAAGSVWLAETKAPVEASAENAQPAGQSAQWRPPLLPGAKADQQQLGAQGLYAVLVLPFTAESPDVRAERVAADRLSDDLISDLSRVPAIRVISRQTSRLYRGRPVDVAAVGSELGVRYVVEGHVRLDGDRLLVNVALTETASRLQVWSERVAREGAERQEVHDEIIRGLARRLQINVVGAEDRRQVPPREPANPAIRDLLAKGWGAMAQLASADERGGADRYFEEVLKREPDNFSAMTGLAAHDVQAATMFLLADPEPRLERAERYLRQVIRTHPRASLPHFYLGMLLKVRGRPQEALSAFIQVLELNPSYAPAYAQVGHVLSRIGRLPEAIEHVRYAVRLSPKDHALGVWSLFAGQIELELERMDSALAWLKRAVELTPNSPFAHATLAAAYALGGDHANASRSAAEARKAAPWMTMDQMKGRLAGLSENGGAPRRLMEGLDLAFASSL